MRSIVAAKITAIGVFVGVFGGLLGFIAFPKIVENEILKSVVLVEGSELYSRWETLPLPIRYSIYFFNVSNPDDVQNGAKPIVKEIGPYVYNQYKRNANVTRKDGVLSFYLHQRFEFNAKASAPLKEDDEITILNLPLMAVATIAEYTATLPYFQLGALDGAIPAIFNNPSSVFMTTTPRDFLFDGVDLMCNASGLIDNLVCNMIENYAPALYMPRLEDGRFRFSVNGQKNNTNLDYYSVNSGEIDIYQMAETIAWRNRSTLDIWKENGTCNELSGTDATVFPPFRKMDSTINIFNPDICRTVTVTYVGNVTYLGIDAYRYVLDKNTYSSPSNYSENECFCLESSPAIKGDERCPLDGVVDLWKCQGVPVFVSYPHFYQANEVYQNGVDGLKPNESIHMMFVEIEPMAGIELHAARRGQVNMFIRPIPHISLTANLPDTLMPIFWMEESFELNTELTDKIKTKLYLGLDILAAVKWGSIICGALLFIFGLIGVLKSMWGPSEFMKLELATPPDHRSCSNFKEDILVQKYEVPAT